MWYFRVQILVFIHGWGATGAIWQRQRGAFAARGPALYPDIPAWEPDWMANYLGSLPLRDCVLVGWSLGGMMLLETLPRMAARPAGLVLVGAAASFCRRPDHPYGQPPAEVRAMRRGLKTGPGAVLRDFAKRCLASGEASFQEEILGYFRAPASLGNLASGLDFLVRQDCRGMLEEISGAVVIIQGDQDAIVPPAQGQFLHEQIPGSKLFRLENAGHVPFLTQAEKFNAILEVTCKVRPTHHIKLD
jgi:pimeloyl-[acyl-carrier protein] methyl ester esterase